MHELCVMFALWNKLQQTYSLLSDSHGKVHKVMNIKKMFSWNVEMVCIRLDNDWTQK